VGISGAGPSRHSRLVCETVAIGERQTLTAAVPNGSVAYDPKAVLRPSSGTKYCGHFTLYSFAIDLGRFARSRSIREQSG
jgi:hypothetical protein